MQTAGAAGGAPPLGRAQRPPRPLLGFDELRGHHPSSCLNNCLSPSHPPPHSSHSPALPPPALLGVRSRSLIEDKAGRTFTSLLVALVEPLMKVAGPDFHRQRACVFQDAGLLRLALFMPRVTRGTDAPPFLKCRARGTNGSERDLWHCHYTLVPTWEVT